MSNIHAITMPKWGIEMEEGMLTEWLVDAGGEVSKGQALIDIETAKIVNTLESPWSGTLKRIIANTGDTLPVGALLGIVCEGTADDVEIDAFISAFKPVDASFENTESTAKDTASAPPTTPSKASAAKQAGKVRVSPPVRRLAESLGVDLATLDNSGPRITKEMVEAAASGKTSTNATTDTGTAAPTETTVTTLSNRRKTIASRLIEAKTTIPHYYLSADLIVDPLLETKTALQKSGIKASVNDLLVYCVARALIEVPQTNVNLLGDEVHTFKHANVSIAIATDDGLVAPVLQRADTLDIASVSSGIRDLVTRAQSSKLNAADYEHGSFTVSNLGMHGIDSFQAIVNPPQGAILAIGAASEKMVVANGAAEIKTVITANLSCDHRIIDGATGAGFLAALKTQIASADIK